MAQIHAEPAQHREPIDARARVQMRHALVPALSDLTGERLARFHLRQKETIQIEKDLLTAHASPAVSSAACFQERLESGCERTAEKTGCHIHSFPGQGIATSLSELRSALA